MKIENEFKNRIKKHSIIAGIIFIGLFIIIFNMDLTKKNEYLNYLYTDTVDKFTDMNREQMRNISNVKNNIYTVSEKTLRNQMRLNLEAVGKKIEDKMNDTSFDGMTKDELISYLTKIVYSDTVYQRTYNAEGDWFVLLTVGGYTYFLIDDSDDCGEPRLNGKRILSIKNRTRTLYDEVVWQEELKYFLAMSNLIPMPKYMKEYHPQAIQINKYIAHDEKLTNIEIYRYRDLVYIEKNYPELYAKLKTTGIIMHAKPELAEKFMDFISFNRASVENDRLYWNFKEEPRREILETYVVPTGVYGFFKESRTMGAGVFNDNYLKITLVAGAQIHDYQSKEFKPVVDKIDTIVLDSQDFNNKYLENLRKEKEEIIKYNNRNMVIITIIFLICLIFSIYSYSRIPEYMPKEYIERYFCASCKPTKDEKKEKI